MRLSPELRERFRRYGREGARARARNLAPARRSSIARRAALRRWTGVRFGAPSFTAGGFPGGEMVDAGLDDLAEGRQSVESLMVSLASSRLRRERVPLPAEVFDDPDRQLYRLLERQNPGLAHARYLACLRQMASFADACRTARTHRRGRSVSADRVRHAR